MINVERINVPHNTRRQEMYRASSDTNPKKLLVAAYVLYDDPASNYAVAHFRPAAQFGVEIIHAQERENNCRLGLLVLSSEASLYEIRGASEDEPTHIQNCVEELIEIAAFLQEPSSMIGFY